MTDKQRIWAKIQVIYKALQKQSSWYTGISIKRFLRKKVFDLQTPKFDNSAINAGRWSAYCHYSQEKALLNLLDKNRIEFGSSVIVHPLLPQNLVDVLLEKEVEIIFLDIDKATLSMRPDEVLQKITSRKNSKPVDLIIHYGFNGLYEEVVTMLKSAQQLVVPSILVVDNQDINLSLLDAFEALAFGAFLWNFGDSFFDEQLDLVLDTKLESFPWFVSFQIETRTLSALEYHLSESHQVVLPLVKAYFYLLLDKYREFGVFEKAYFWLADLIWFKDSFKSLNEAQNELKEKYNKFFETSAVPDLVFDLQSVSPENETVFDTGKELIEKSVKFQTKAKDLYDHFIQNIPKHEEGSLEIPNFFLDRGYTKYFLYTVETKFWQDEMKRFGLFSETLGGVHQLVKEDQGLSNANFVADYGLFVNVWGVA